MTVLLVLILVVFALAVVLASMAKVVPQQEAWIVERMGRYSMTLKAGLHVLTPFFDSVRYRHSLKEQVIEVQEQDCITKDNVLIKVDAVLYYQIIDPVRASYGISNPEAGVVQLAQTTVRSEIGKIELDRTFEERAAINAHIVGEIDNASEAWGVKVLRYEIKNIKPPPDIREAMERQMRAERDKRAAILESEGKRDALINTAEGQKQEDIKASKRANNVRSTKPKATPQLSARSRWRRRTEFGKSPRRSANPAAPMPCNCGSPSNTCTNLVTSPNRELRSSCPPISPIWPRWSRWPPMSSAPRQPQPMALAFCAAARIRRHSRPQSGPALRARPHRLKVGYLARNWFP
jgi:regulator of protease activity HflC (stomatin/prohibitin superfamily)